MRQEMIERGGRQNQITLGQFDVARDYKGTFYALEDWELHYNKLCSLIS